VTELGGAVVREPWDSEFGRFCQVTDATGGFFVLSSVTPG
jgi:predicted enzyme related to lactoylglutathione lyase